MGARVGRGHTADSQVTALFSSLFLSLSQMKQHDGRRIKRWGVGVRDRGEDEVNGIGGVK